MKALSTPQYAALFEAMRRWVDDGQKPDTAAVARLCEGYAPAFGEPCLFELAFKPSTAGKPRLH
jgi:hypothetical protein